MPRSTPLALLISEGEVSLNALFFLPPNPKGVVIFAHGSGSGRMSPRNQFVASELARVGFASVLADLLTEEEADDRDKVFDLELLAARIGILVEWVCENQRYRRLPIGLFGASTGAGAALIAAVHSKARISAIVSRGGRPDLARDALPHVKAPTLLIVGGADTPVIAMNRWAKDRMTAPSVMKIVPEATHLFEEPGALEEVAQLAVRWFEDHMETRSEVRPLSWPEASFPFP